jgi:thiamine biosynthesis protein ThiI
MPSDQVNRELGDLVLRHFPTRVNLTEPALTVRVDLLPGEALVFVDRVAGPGGLPVGVSGRVAALLSGGIDSPVAACRLQKRGCEVEFVHFHSVPYLSDTSQRKARTLVERLVRHQFVARLWLVPFGEIQREVVLGVPAPLRVVVYRRFMARIAEAIARKTGALALVTGESLGQVASQTLENIARTTEVAGMPILRPSSGPTRRSSARPERSGPTRLHRARPDCCTLFVPKHPGTRATWTPWRPPVRLGRPPRGDRSGERGPRCSVSRPEAAHPGAGSCPAPLRAGARRRHRPGRAGRRTGPGVAVRGSTSVSTPDTVTRVVRSPTT